MTQTLHKAMKMRLYPSVEQAGQIDATLGACRFVYNHMLERNTKAYRRRGEHLSYVDMQNLLPGMKCYLPWLAKADSKAVQHACRQLDDAYKRFFKKQGGYPRFKSKHSGRQAYTSTNPACMHYEPGRIKLPKLGWVGCSDNRDLMGEICRVTVSREADGNYYASLLYKYEADVPEVIVDPNNVIGLDYKSTGLFVDSDGGCADMPHYYKEAQKRQARQQRRLSRKMGSRKGEAKSNNYIKQKARLYKIQKHTANQRRDFLHKLSTAIAKQYDAVVAEDLDLKTMASAGYGNGKAAADNGYEMFLAFLKYKLKERGKQLIRVDRWYPSSQVCHACGIKKKLLLSERVFRCPKCGAVFDRDVNAAINIKTEGLRLLKAASAA